jgi:hypothetical protein
MRVLKNMAAGAGTIAELVQFLWAQRLWWLLPFVATLLLLAILLLIGEVTGVAPFIYTLF